MESPRPIGRGLIEAPCRCPSRNPSSLSPRPIGRGLIEAEFDPVPQRPRGRYLPGQLAGASLKLLRVVVGRSRTGYLPGQLAGASLKRRQKERLADYGLYLPGQLAGASLKLLQQGPGASRAGSSPRPIGRGLIEAPWPRSPATGPSRSPRPIGRGLIEARIRLEMLRRPMSNLPGQLAGASLKPIYPTYRRWAPLISPANWPGPH